MKVKGRHYRTLWMEGDSVCMINQTLLPFAFEVFRSERWTQTAEAIRTMTVRGAPAIGIAGGFGLVQAFREGVDPLRARDLLLSTRPTGRDLAFVLERVRAAGAQGARAEAQRLADASIEECRLIGRHGRPLIRDGMKILTHCNAGWLATVDVGTQTAPIYLARAEKAQLHVFVDRTGPRDQGARLTAWELGQEGISHEVIEDSAAGHLMSRGEIDLVLVGADRIAANGDVANKIGTYMVALAAREHRIPFYVAAPRATFDATCASGRDIPIEERPAEEVLFRWGADEEGVVRRVRVAAPGSTARNPAFDVTPAELISGILTPAGIVQARPSAIGSYLKS